MPRDFRDRVGAPWSRRLLAAATGLVLAGLPSGCAFDGSEANPGPPATRPVASRPDTRPTTPWRSPPEPTDDPTGTGEGTPAPPSTPAPEPTESTDPSREAELERLRATNQFLEFAEADRAKHATWARFAYDRFAVRDGGETLFEWANKDELWNSIAPRVRDECLLAGPELDRPMWDAEIVIPSGLSPTWNDDDTAGRGYFVEFSCMHYAAGNSPAELWMGALISEANHHGTLVRLSRPIVLHERDHNDLATAGKQARQILWEWVIET